MKNLFTALSLLFAFAFFSSCAGTGEKQAENYLLSAADFQKKMAETNNEVLIDLRSHGELHQIGPIASARLLDFNGGVFEKIHVNFPKEGNTYMLYCNSGNRSAKAVEMMKTAGIENVYELDGGIQAWKAAGLPIQAHSH